MKDNTTLIPPNVMKPARHIASRPNADRVINAFYVAGARSPKKPDKLQPHRYCKNGGKQA